MVRTKHDNKLIAMQATLSILRNIRYSVERRDNRSESATNSKISGTGCFDSEINNTGPITSEFLAQVERVAKALMAHGDSPG